MTRYDMMFYDMIKYDMSSIVYLLTYLCICLFICINRHYIVSGHVCVCVRVCISAYVRASNNVHTCSMLSGPITVYSKCLLVSSTGVR